jgi:hypothetical protein
VNSKQKKKDAQTHMFLERVELMDLAYVNRAQLHMPREPGLLRSLLITVLDLAHVHAGRQGALAAPKRTRSKKRDADTQVHILREPGLLRSALVTALDLAHVHAAPANSALFLPEVSLLLLFSFGAGRRCRACCVLRRRNLAHGNGQRHEH